jgi:Zn-finger nucleic acid-binding protein
MSDPYRTAPALHSPRCRIELEPADLGPRCTRCGGSFVRERDLSRTLRHRMWWRDPELMCPVCEQPMQPVLAGEETIDRCRSGDELWFDNGELAAMLREADA